MSYNLKIFTDNIAPNAVNQVYTLLETPPFANSVVRIMPDAHIGRGCVVGFTATLGDKVIPNVIGVDIGCGMLTVCLGKIEPDLRALDEFIRKYIPAGTNVREKYAGVELIKELYCFDELEDQDRAFRSLGTLGGGNHFIELDKDDEGNVYLVIHTGSRNVGLQVANIYQRRAIEACKHSADNERERVRSELMAQGKPEALDEALLAVAEKYADRTKSPPQLCYFEGAECEAYLHDMRICQEFAVRNRAKIAEDIMHFLGVYKAESFETMHNFIDDDKIVRKGAIPAHRGQRVIIPMNMRDGCIIAIGKGNEDWNSSAPHGAGRLVSRARAKELFTEDEYRKSMEGIYTTSVCPATIDESPMAYKPMEEIISLIGDTVEIEKIIKPIYNFKHK